MGIVGAMRGVLKVGEGLAEGDMGKAGRGALGTALHVAETCLWVLSDDDEAGDELGQKGDEILDQADA